MECLLVNPAALVAMGATEPMVALVEPEGLEERQEDRERLPEPMDSEEMEEMADRPEPQETAAMEPLAVRCPLMAATAATAALRASPELVASAEQEPEARPAAQRELMDLP